VKSPNIQRTLALFAVVAFAAFGGSEALAQESGRVAILDVAKVFKQTPSFVSEMDKIKEQADQLKVKIKSEQDDIKDAVQQLSTEPRSEARNQKEAELEQRHTRLRTTTRQAEADLLNREARVYYDTYLQMQAVVESMATEYGLSLVLRFDSQEINANNRNEVIKGINRAVVFHRKLDLTDMVSNALNARMAEAGGTQNR